MRTIGLLNDSFPPQIDGVANAILNYATEIRKGYGTPIVITPDYPYSEDSKYDFPIYRYRSVDVTKKFNVVAGIPLAPKLERQIKSSGIELIHSHCPASSQLLARLIREGLGAPLVMTYHSKFDIDIHNVIKVKKVADNIISAMVENISASDEIWTVSDGAGKNLQSLGYEGDYIVMKNGVDLPHEKVGAECIRDVTGSYDLPGGIPVFLFVGRMMWYKGIRLIIDALTGLKAAGTDFRMVFVGNGTDFAEIHDYVSESGIEPKCIFVGNVYNRDDLRAWYSRADLLLFPSTFDTFGLVVREAAACSLPAVLVEGSCAAEDVIDGHNGYLIQENAVALAIKLDRIIKDMDNVRQVGINAGNELYISWEDSVKKATDRYEVVIDNYKSGKYPKHERLSDKFLSHVGELASFGFFNQS